jgi:hypothetical protein
MKNYTTVEFTRLRDQVLNKLHIEHKDVVIALLDGQYRVGNMSSEVEVSEDQLRSINQKLKIFVENKNN